ncbi:MAG: glycosyltransferase family 4 protein [Nanoarchaeota archaeon]
MTKIPIKVCFIAFDAYQLFNESLSGFKYTGADIQLYQLAKEISKNKNFEISFLVGNFNQRSIEKYDGIKVYRYNGNTSNKFFLMHHLQGYGLFKTLKKIDADIYIQRSASTLTGQISSFCKMFNKKFIFMVAHKKDCDISYSKIEKLFGHYLYPIGIYRYLFGVKNADLIITQNQEQYELLKKKLGRTSKLIKSAYKIEKNSVLKKNHILWVARGIKWKQPEIFIGLAKNFPKEKFVMICPGNTSYKESIKEIAINAKNLKFIDEVPFNNIDEYFKKAKLFVSTSVHEGFPNTFVQAAKNGTPIISLNINPDNILDGHKIGFHSKNFENLKKDISCLLNDKKLYKKISSNALLYAKENHDITVIKKQYESLLESLSKT